jgi:UDP-galactopyranose mutase
MLDYLIVGSGLYGSVLARELTDCGKKVRVLEKRNHIGGNCYTENVRGIHVHKYGPHYFHTNKVSVWSYVNRFVNFYTNVPRVKAKYRERLYSFPVNLMTLHQVYGVNTPSEAQAILSQVKEPIDNPKNFEEFVVSKVGWDLYRMFYEGYTTKQWGRHPRELPAYIAKRIPIRFTANDTYHEDAFYMGIPMNGYTELFERLLKDIDIELNTDFFAYKTGWWRSKAKHLIYSGCIDQFYDYRFGRLEYRSLRQETQVIKNHDFQGTAQINYSDLDIPYTRIIEHKHIQYNGSNISDTVVTHEYPEEYDGRNEPFYPINSDSNQAIYRQYKNLLDGEKDVTIGGRLGAYRYMDMDDVIQMALIQADKLRREQ